MGKELLMPLTFTFDEGFLETPDETQEDAIKLAKLVVEWWKHEEFLARLEDMVYPKPEMVILAKQLLEKEHAANILR